MKLKSLKEELYSNTGDKAYLDVQEEATVIMDHVRRYMQRPIWNSVFDTVLKSVDDQIRESL